MKKRRRRKQRKIAKILVIIIPILMLLMGLVFYNIYKDSKEKEDNVVVGNTVVAERDETLYAELENIEDDNEFISALKEMAKEDSRIIEILINKDIYPEKLLEMLSRNKDMISYMSDYENMKGHIYIDNIGKVTKGEYPLLLQYDKKWGYGIYGDNVMAINGCGPTSLAMVVAGLTGLNDTTPYDIAKYSYEKGYYTEEGTRWDLMTIGIKNFGVVGKKIVLTKSNLYNELNSGHPLIASMRPGDFTTVGHFIVLTGIKDNKIVVNDPNSIERSNKLWDYDIIAPQIKGLWTFSVIE